MSVSGKSFLELANWLQQQTSCEDEIKYRSCVNRAYYCLFHITKEYLLRSFLTNNPKANHQEVIQLLKQEDELLGNKLYYFFEERKKADYSIHRDLSKKKAERLVRDMETFPQELNENA